MKVLFLNRSKNFRGYSFEELFTSIKSQLYNFEVVDFYDKTYSSFFRNIIAVRKIKCDVIHITGGIGYYALFLPTRKTILTVHDTNHYEFDLTGIRRWLYGLFIYRLPIMNVKYVTTVSTHTKNNLIHFFKIQEKKIIVIPNCYPDDFKPCLSQGLNSPLRLLNIGTKPNKNLPRLIEAIKDLNIELTIIGKLNTEIVELLKKYNIYFINKYNLKREEIYREYMHCDLVCFISLREGFGMPIVEANAVGRPIITSNISPITEIACDSACFVNPTNIEDIKNGILKIVNNKAYRIQLIEAGFENVKRFSPLHVANLYAHVYRNLLDSKDV